LYLIPIINKKINNVYWLFVCSCNKFTDSVKSVNVPLTDQSLVKCKSIKEVHDRN